MDFAEFQIAIGALCAWKEARGEGADGIRAVLHVIANRAGLREQTWPEVVYAPLQFTSMTYGHDPELGIVPKQSDEVFLECLSLANNVFYGSDSDNTEGATHYFNPKVAKPTWAASLVLTATIGNHEFYKEP